MNYPYDGLSQTVCSLGHDLNYHTSFTTLQLNYNVTYLQVNRNKMVQICTETQNQEMKHLAIY